MGNSHSGAVIRSFLRLDNAKDFTIVAVTRSMKSRSAQSLASHSNISIVEGDLDDVAAIFEKMTNIGPVWGVFSVQIAAPGTNTEEKQGRSLVDAAIVNGVCHFVYSYVQNVRIVFDGFVLIDIYRPTGQVIGVALLSRPTILPTLATFLQNITSKIIYRKRSKQASRKWGTQSFDQ